MAKRKYQRATHGRAVSLLLDCMEERLTDGSQEMRTKRDQRKAFNAAVKSCRRIMGGY